MLVFAALNKTCVTLRRTIILLLLLFLIFLDPGTSFPGCETLNKVYGVWNGYNGDSEIVKVLDRQTVLKLSLIHISEPTRPY